MQQEHQWEDGNTTMHNLDKLRDGNKIYYDWAINLPAEDLQIAKSAFVHEPWENRLTEQNPILGSGDCTMSQEFPRVLAAADWQSYMELSLCSGWMIVNCRSSVFTRMVYTAQMKLVHWTSHKRRC